MNITIKEYLDKKRKLCNLKANRGFIKKVDRLEAHDEKIKNTKYEIEEAKKQPNIIAYHNHLKRISHIKQQIGIRQRYGKDTSGFEEVRLKLEEQLKYLIENDTTPDTTPNTTPDTTQHTHTHTRKNTPHITNKTEPCYYIINLAWTNITDIVKKSITGFLCRSSYIKMDESNNMISWKFSYDTIEEITMVKSLITCSSHMIDILKNIEETDAEVFGKIQKY